MGLDSLLLFTTKDASPSVRHTTNQLILPTCIVNIVQLVADIVNTRRIYNNDIVAEGCDRESDNLRCHEVSQ
jgi:hypothetical protein